MRLRRTIAFATIVVFWCVMATPEARRKARADTHILAVTLVAAAQVPDTVQRVMRVEAARIWQHEGVGVTWNQDATRDHRDTSALRVVFVQAELGLPADDRRYAIAEFHRAHRRILVSLSAAERAVTHGLARINGAGWPAEPHDRAWGLVLGRALAHELGHYLLGTAVYSRRGLMRASFPARDLVDPRAANFFLLDDGDAALVSARIDAGLLAPTMATH